MSSLNKKLNNIIYLIRKLSILTSGALEIKRKLLYRTPTVTKFLINEDYYFIGNKKWIFLYYKYNDNAVQRMIRINYSTWWKIVHNFKDYADIIISFKNYFLHCNPSNNITTISPNFSEVIIKKVGIRNTDAIFKICIGI